MDRRRVKKKRGKAKPRNRRRKSPQNVGATGDRVTVAIPAADSAATGIVTFTEEELREALRVIPTTNDLPPELGEKVWEDNGHRWTWVHPRPQRGRCVCIDCDYVRCFPIRREEEPACVQKERRPAELRSPSPGTRS